MNWHILVPFIILVALFVYAFYRIFKSAGTRSQVSDNLNIKCGWLAGMFACFFSKGIMCLCRYINPIGRLHCEKCGRDLLKPRGILNAMVLFAGISVLALGLIDRIDWLISLGCILIIMSTVYVLFFTAYQRWAMKVEKLQKIEKEDQATDGYESETKKDK